MEPNIFVRIVLRERFARVSMWLQIALSILEKIATWRPWRGPWTIGVKSPLHSLTEKRSPGRPSSLNECNGLFSSVDGLPRILIKG
jgi:hypothetical protein